MLESTTIEIIGGSELVRKQINHVDRSLGTRMRERRTERGLSQEALADKLQVDPKEIDLYEAGAKRMSADRLLRIAKALGVRPVYFFGFTDAKDGDADDVTVKSCETAGG